MTTDQSPSASADPDRSAHDAVHDVESTLDTIKAHFAETQGIAPFNQVISFVTETYLADLDPARPPRPAALEQQLLAIVNGVVAGENAKTNTRAMKLPMAKHLIPWQIAQALLRLHHVKRIAPSDKDTDREYDLLAMYQASGPGRGTYTVSEDDIRMKARRYHAGLTLNDFKEVMAVLKEDAPRTTQCLHRDLIAVGNGIFHYADEPARVVFGDKEFSFGPKTLLPFDPELVFLAKCHVDYVADAPNPVFVHPVDGSSWDIVSWIDELTDDEGVADLLWEIIGAIIRPHVRWNKTAWFYSEAGNNGKGTLCALMRNLCGPRSHTSIPLADFGKSFALEPLVRANAIIVDENDVGTFIDKAANLKAVVTGDVIQIDRKYRMPIAYQFFGFMVQCLNEFPRVKDKSESFYRRQLFVPFTKSFTGAEKRYIKDDYLQRPEVLEYALWHVLHKAGTSEHKPETSIDAPGSYYELAEPPPTKVVLAEYKEANDPVRAFWEEFRGLFVWNLLPFTFLYDLYKVWFVSVSPSGSPLSRQQFVTDLVAIVKSDTEWHCPDKNRKVRPGKPDTGLMSEPETLIAEFDLKAWRAPGYTGTDPDKISRPLLKPNYRGLLRQTAVGDDGDQDALD